MTALALRHVIPSRMLNEWTYCPRLAILEWVHGDWAESADTVEGSHVHRRVDRPGRDLPEDPPEDGFVTRSLWLTSDAEGITARMDVVEADGGELVPVDTKRGEAPDVEHGAWDADRVQIAAQALVLRSHGHNCSRGYVYYASSKRRVEVPIDDALVDQTRRATVELREAAESGKLPLPLLNSPKCPRCSLVGICLPDETNLLKLEDDGNDTDEPRQLAAPRYEGLPLYVSEQGATVGAREGELVVSRGKTELARARVRETSHLALFGNINVTPAALRTAMDEGLPVTFFSFGGWFRGAAQGHPHKNVVLRLAQFDLHRDRENRLRVAQAIVRGKIRNQRTILRRNHPSIGAEVLDELTRLARDVERVPDEATLLGVEGAAARLYFKHFAGTLTGRGGDGAPAFEWTARNRRPPRDPVNAMLSLAYALLSRDCFVALASVGFDPYVGFYHAPRYGKPALALALMEELRPIVADSVVMTAVNQGEVDANSFVTRADGCNLTEHGRKSFLRAYERRMDALVTHPTFGYRLSWRRVIELQARLLGKVCLGELDAYVPMETR